MALKYCPFCMELFTPDKERCPHCDFNLSIQAEKEALSFNSILKDRFIVGKLNEELTDYKRYIGFDLIKKEKVWIQEFFPKQYIFRDVGETKIQIYAGQKDKYLKKYEESVQIWKHQSDDKTVVYANGTVYQVWPLSQEEQDALIKKEELVESSPQNLKESKEDSIRAKFTPVILNKKSVAICVLCITILCIVGIAIPGISLELKKDKNNSEGQVVQLQKESIVSSPLPTAPPRSYVSPSPSPVATKVAKQTPSPTPTEKTAEKKRKKKKINSTPLPTKQTQKIVRSENNIDTKENSGKKENNTNIDDKDVQESVFDISDEDLK